MTKTKGFLLAVAVAAMAFTFSCSGGGGGSGGDTYTGTAEGVTYTLKVEDDKYTLTQNADSKKSTGTVTKDVGGVLTLSPKGDPGDAFTATVSGNGITAMSGTITWDDGTANTAPSTLTPGGSTPGGGNGTWTEIEGIRDLLPGVSRLTYIAYGNGRWVATTDDDERKMLLTSTNGINWTAIDLSSVAGGWNGVLRNIAYGNGIWVLSGSSYSFSSTDGINWVRLGYNTTVNGQIAFGNNRFVIVNRTRSCYSSDGITWTTTQHSAFSSGSTIGVNDIAYGDNKFIAVGEKGEMASSPDGETWTAIANTAFDNSTNIRSIAYGDGRWVAVGRSGDIAKMATSTDGVNWTAIDVSSIFTTEFIEYGAVQTVATYPLSVCYGGGRWFAGSDYSIIATSTDGTTWTQTIFAEQGLLSMRGARDIAYGGNKFVAVGYIFLTPLITYWQQ